MKKALLIVLLAGQCLAQNVDIVRGIVSQMFLTGTGTDRVFVWGVTPPEPSLITVSFDYNFFDSNMQASLEYASAEYTSGSAFGILPACASTGPRYVFNNWQDESFNVYDTASTVPASAITLHASFTDNGASAYITFDLQGFNVSQPDTINVYDGWSFRSGDYGNGTFFPSWTYDVSDNQFLGWYTGSGGGGAEVVGTDIYYTSSGISTLYAWYCGYYGGDLYVDGNLQKGLLNQQSFNVYSSGAFPSDPQPSSPLQFEGWHTAQGGGGTKILGTDTYDYKVYLGNDVYIYAFYSHGTVTFNTNGGTGDTPSFRLFDGCPFNRGGDFPNAPTQEGYVFTGWYDYGSGGNKIESTTTYSYATYNGDLLLYAYWVLAPIPFYFDPTGGPSYQNPLGTADYYSAEYSPGTMFFNLPTFYSNTPEYTWNGAYYDSNSTEYTGYSTVPSSSITLYPSWTYNNPDSNISFYLNGGTGDTPSFGVYYGWALTTMGSFPADPTYDGYTFAGWTDTYSNIIGPSDLANGDNHILTAQWTAN